MKICVRCRCEKQVTEFYSDRSRSDGLCRYCKACHCEIQREWSRRNPGSKAFFSKRWRKNTGGYAGEIQRASSADAARKADFSDHLKSGDGKEAVRALIKGNIYNGILESLICADSGIGLTPLLVEVYPAAITEQGRRKALSSMKRHIFMIRKHLIGTGYTIKNLGYGKGYAFARDA